VARWPCQGGGCGVRMLRMKQRAAVSSAACWHASCWDPNQKCSRLQGRQLPPVARHVMSNSLSSTCAMQAWRRAVMGGNSPLLTNAQEGGLLYHTSFPSEWLTAAIPCPGWHAIAATELRGLSQVRGAALLSAVDKRVRGSKAETRQWAGADSLWGSPSRIAVPRHAALTWACAGAQWTTW
jgi:hypothetical protein